MNCTTFCAAAVISDLEDRGFQKVSGVGFKNGHSTFDFYRNHDSGETLLVQVSGDAIAVYGQLKTTDELGCKPPLLANYF